MKSLSYYLKNTQNKLLKKYGVFWAFGEEQLKELTKPGIRYTQFADGGFLPSNNFKKFQQEYNNMVSDAILLDKKDHTQKQIIWRELNNYEFQYSEDITEILNQLKAYKFSEDVIKKESKKYLKHCLENDSI